MPTQQQSQSLHSACTSARILPKVHATLIQLNLQAFAHPSVVRAYAPRKVPSIWSLPVTFSNQLKKSWGNYSDPPEELIKLHPEAAENPKILRHILAHEVAHLLSVRLYGVNIPTHGTQWKSIFSLLGFQPIAKPSFQLPPKESSHA